MDAFGFLVKLLLVSLGREAGSTCSLYGLALFPFSISISLHRTKSKKTFKMPFGSCFNTHAIALALLCCCTVLITLPVPSSALKSSRDTSITLQSNSKKQGHRKSVRDVYNDVRGTSSSAAAKATLFNSLFWDEGMDVTRFHTCLKAELSRVMLDLSAEEEKKTAKHKRDPSSSSSHRQRQPTALVVGVEYGTDVIELAQAGFDVLGIEPFPEYVAHVVSEAAKANVLDKVNIYSAGAGAELGNMSITYYQGSVTTPIVRLDDVVKGRTIDILSVDVHGGATNYDVLLGGKESLGRGLFKSIWCELFPDTRPKEDGGDWGVKLLDLLREHDYILYDLQWSGGAKSCEFRGIPSNLCDELRTHSGARPLDSAQTYLDAMHRMLETDFQYLQTDFVAVPRAMAGRVAPAFRKASAACREK